MMRKHLKKGFTLVEVLLAGAILVLAASSSFILLRALSQGILNSSELTKSVYSATAKLEELKTVDFDSLSYQDGKDFSQGKGKIEVKDVLPDLKEINITYTWHPKRTPIEIYTLRSKYE